MRKPAISAPTTRTAAMALTRRIKRFGDTADTGIKGVDCIVVGKAMGAALPLPVCCCSSPCCSGKMYCSEAGSPARGVTGGNARMRASISRYSARLEGVAPSMPTLEKDSKKIVQFPTKLEYHATV